MVESADINKAYNSAIRMLGRREHGVAELRDKLRRKFAELPHDALDELVAELQTDGYLSDERFAESLLRGRINRGYGPFYIRQEMITKGIKVELVEHLLEEAEVDWLAHAEDLVSRRHSAYAHDSGAWEKAARFLQRRGYSSDLVMRALGDRPY